MPIASPVKYNLFLFDADDTLFDFQKSEVLSLRKTLNQLGLTDDFESIYQTYRAASSALWMLLEQGKVSKDFLKVERFRKTFEFHGLTASPEEASRLYLDVLPETVVLLDYAVEICRDLSKRGEVGIITNGIESVQKRRLVNSAIAPFISFIAVSEECGFAKPDVRFFEYSAKLARSFSKERALVIGDRLETDIQGAHNFGLDACFFNPANHRVPSHFKPRYEITHLSQLHQVIS